MSEALTDTPITLGSYVRDRRQTLGLTQSGLADRAGCDRGTIACIEAGTRSMSASAIVRMARALRVSPGRLTRLAAQVENAR